MRSGTQAQLPPAQRALADCYTALRRAVEEHRAELAPYEERNALKALAALWQIANGLDLDPEPLYDLGA
jgi:hypothetical protein